MRALAPLVLVGVLSCGAGRQEPVAAPSDSPSPPTGGSTTPSARKAVPPSAASRAVARTLADVSRVRGIQASRAVPGVKLERAALVGKVKAKATREVPPDALRREGELLQLFGFAPESFDYVAETMSLLEEQLEGFYEPADGTMYLADDLRGKEAQAALAHELVHALQDQRWDLRTRSTYKPGRSDETLALACLAEGDATVAMMDYMLEGEQKTALDMPEGAIRALMTGGAALGTQAKVPNILRASLIAPYIEGLGFILGLRRKGGWAAVDRAWARPPVSTEQVLHLDKWEASEPPVRVGSPPARTLSGFTLDDQDTFGELGLALSFGEWLDDKEAHLAASGWGGDRSALWTRGGEVAFAIRVRYDDAGPASGPAAYAERAVAKIATALKKKLGPATIDAADATCFERPSLGPLAVAQKDKDLVMTLGPAHVGGTQTGPWRSTSSCAQSRLWLAEILASPLLP